MRLEPGLPRFVLFHPLFVEYGAVLAIVEDDFKGAPLSPPVVITVCLKSVTLSGVVPTLSFPTIGLSLICLKSNTLVELPDGEYTPLESPDEFALLSPGKDPSNVYVALNEFKFCRTLLDTAARIVEVKIFLLLANLDNPNLDWKLLYKGDKVPFVLYVGS